MSTSKKTPTPKLAPDVVGPLAGDVGKEEWQEGLGLILGNIYICDEIYSSSADDTIQKLEALKWLRENKVSKAKQLTVKIISSPGGDAWACMAVHDAIRQFARDTKMEVITEAYGDCMSGASMIVLQAGDRRIAHKNVLFMIHETSVTTRSSETTGQHADTQKILDLTNQYIFDILSSRTGRPIEEITALVHRKDIILTPVEALGLGLIDEIAGG